MNLPILVDLFPQFLLIPEGLLLHYSILILLAVCSGLYMGGIHKHYRFVYQSSFHALLQYLLEYPFEQISILEAPYVVLSKGAEMRHGIVQPQAKKPTVGIVYFDLLDCLPHAADSKHILHHRQFD